MKSRQQSKIAGGGWQVAGVGWESSVHSWRGQGGAGCQGRGGRAPHRVGSASSGDSPRGNCRVQFVSRLTPPLPRPPPPPTARPQTAVPRARCRRTRAGRWRCCGPSQTDPDSLHVRRAGWGFVCRRLLAMPTAGRTLQRHTAAHARNDSTPPTTCGAEALQAVAAAAGSQGAAAGRRQVGSACAGSACGCRGHQQQAAQQLIESVAPAARRRGGSTPRRLRRRLSLHGLAARGRSCWGRQPPLHGQQV